MDSSNGGPQAGWYPDPNAAAGQRWWDGQAWTDQTYSADPAPQSTTQPTAPAAPNTPLSFEKAGAIEPEPNPFVPPTLPPHSASPYGASPYGSTPQYGSPQPYGAQPYGAPGYGPPTGNQPTNGMAIASLVLGIVWLCGVGSLLAVILGHVARGRIKQSAGQEKGDGLALGGLILGYLGIVGAVGGTLAVIFGGSWFVTTVDDQATKQELRDATVVVERCRSENHGVYPDDAVISRSEASFVCGSTTETAFFGYGENFSYHVDGGDSYTMSLDSLKGNIYTYDSRTDTITRD